MERICLDSIDDDSEVMSMSERELVDTVDGDLV